MTSNGVKHHTQMAWISTLCIKVYVPTTYFPWPEKVVTVPTIWDGFSVLNFQAENLQTF